MEYMTVYEDENMVEGFSEKPRIDETTASSISSPETHSVEKLQDGLFNTSSLLDESIDHDDVETENDVRDIDVKDSSSKKNRKHQTPRLVPTDQESVCTDESHFIRRSTRDPSQFLLSKGDIKKLLHKIVSNHEDTVVLKIKEHVCQALYIQNISKAMKNEQLYALIKLLQKKTLIWCLNIGENYEITLDGWKFFCKSLPETNITHLYVSEHVIPIELKNEMRAYIRENRKKHEKHCSMKNLAVIERCTNMWWNPINGVKELKPKVPVPSQAPRCTLNDIAQSPASTAFWQEGVGKGGDRPWKFRCTCGEVCSSYESYRYHPVGRMYECSRCSIWSHVDCVLGPYTTNEDLEEIIDLLCSSCNSKISRLKRYYGEDYKQHDDRSDIYELTEKDLVNVREEAKRKREAEELEEKRKQKKLKRKENQQNQPKTNEKKLKLENPTRKRQISTESLKKSNRGRKVQRKEEKEEEEEEDSEVNEDEADGEWKFKCLCGETCSWYEHPLYRPVGRKYQCTNCGIWSHVNCVLGEKVTDAQIHAMQDAFCYTCKSKMRRSRGWENMNQIKPPEPIALPTGNEPLEATNPNESAESSLNDN